MCAIFLTRAVLVTAAAVALTACGTAPKPTAAGATKPGAALSEAAEPSPPVVVPTPAPLLPAGAPLAAEAAWLGELFAGSPVQVAGERDGSVRLQVPLKYAFDGATTPAGAPAAKPPLQAVLDKLSQSLKRQPGARLQAAAPGPSSAERVAAIRGHLAGKGVAGWRVAAATGAPMAGQVLLRLVPGTRGLQQLDDASLPTSGAVRSGGAVPQATRASRQPG